MLYFTKIIVNRNSWTNAKCHLNSPLQTLSHEPKVLQEGLCQLDSILTNLEPLHRPIEMPGGSVLLRELANAGHVTDATLSARATPLLHALTAAHAYILMFVHTCRVGQVNIYILIHLL